MKDSSNTIIYQPLNKIHFPRVSQYASLLHYCVAQMAIIANIFHFTKNSLNECNM